MPDENAKLYLYEALELRALYDRKIRLLNKLVKPEEGRRGAWSLVDREGGDLKPAPGFELKAAEEGLKRLKTKRLKLNEAIQVANFRAELDFEGEKISLARALEQRKALLEDLERLAERTLEAAYIKVIHKEERDIEKLPPRPYEQTRAEHEQALERLRGLVTALHRANHTVTVGFRDE